MKNSFKLGFVALVLAASFSACNGDAKKGGDDTSKTVVDTQKTVVDTQKTVVDTTKVDTIKKDTTKK